MAFKLMVRLAAAMFLAFIGLSTAAAGPLHIVCMGDSLTAGYELPPGKSFPEQLEAALASAGHDVTVTNAGVSGDTSSDGLARIDWSVPDGTDLVILEFGGNDMLRGLDPATTRKNIDAMLARLKQRNIHVLLAGMLAAPNMGKDYGQRFGAIFPELAKKYDVPLYPFFLDGVAGKPALQLADAMHPNAEGVAVMVDHILPTVEKMLSSLRGANGT